MKIKHTHKKHASAADLRKTRQARLRLATFTMLPLVFAVSQTLANPDGGVVVGGQAAITQRPGVTIVDQASNRTIINWNGFSIDPGELTKFNQPGVDAIALNRVIGNDPSQLLGALEANGQVWLLNQNGILFGPSARIDVHGLLATTADIANQDFMAGRNQFSIPSSNAGAEVINQGSISIGEHGLAALVAPHVRNTGIIQGKLGQVVIAGAPTFTLDFYGDGLIQFQATSKVTENANPDEALVRNDGTISVNGGNVLITADAAAGIVDETINMDGIIEARSVGMQNGMIVLRGGDEGTVHVAGQLDASGAEPGTTGGSVDILGTKILVADSADINTSGSSGGGKVHIGGDLRGEGDRPNASQTIVMPEAVITADAVDTGDGGQVVVWANDSAKIHGQITARGGRVYGDGGFIETSSKKHLVLTSTPDASAANGKGGTWLIDPANITIVPGAAPPPDIEASIEFDVLAVGTDFETSQVFAQDISDVLNLGTNVVLDTSTLPDFDEPGNITQESRATISKTAGADASLTLIAHNNIILNDQIIASGKIGEDNIRLNVTLNADQDEIGGGAIEMNPGSVISTNGGDIVMGGGSDPLTTAAVGTVDSINGITIRGASIFSSGGDISLRGTGYSGAKGNASGINLGGSRQNSEAKVITSLTYLFSGDGDISLTGIGGQNGTGERNIGINIQASTIVEATGSGSITLNGAGGSGTNDTTGITISNAAIISANGQLNLTGTGGDGGDISQGIRMQNDARLTSTEGGTIILDGTQGGTDANSILATGDSGVRTSGITTLIGGTGDISLANSNNDFGTVVITSANDVTIEDINGLSLSTATVSGDIEVTAGAADDNVFSGIKVSGPVSADGSITLDATGDVEVNAAIVAGDFVALRSRKNQDTGVPGDILVNAAITAGFGPDDSGLTDASLEADRNIMLNSGGNLTVATDAHLHADMDLDGTGIIDNPGNTTISLSDVLTLAAAEGIGTTTNPIQTFVLRDSGGLFEIKINAETRTGDIQIVNAGVNDTDAGRVALVDTENPSFTTDGDISVSNSFGDLVVDTAVTGGDVTIVSGGVLTLNQPIATGTGEALILLVTGGGFQNEVGESGLQPGDGRYLVYSPHPEQDNREIPVDQFSKRYGFSYDADDPEGLLRGLPTDDNFFLYGSRPTLTLTADDASRGFAESNPAFTYTPGELIDGDTVETALDSMPILTTTADLISFPDAYPIAIDPELASTLGYEIVLVPGKLTVTPGILGDAQIDSLIRPDLPLEELLKPAVPLVLTEHTSPTFAVPDLPSLSDSSDLLSPNDGNRELWGAPR